MKNLKYFIPFLLCGFLMTSCEKEVAIEDLPVVEVESALDFAYRYANGTEAAHQADHIDEYISNCQDAGFVNIIQETNEAMTFTGFDYFNASKVYSSNDVLFYPVLRSNEQDDGFLNLCMPFYRLDKPGEDPMMLMEGPGVTAIGILTDLFNGSGGGGRGGDDITPIIVNNPGMGSFSSGYYASYLTKNGEVTIDYTRNGYTNREGVLHIVVKSTNDYANIDQSWLIKY